VSSGVVGRARWAERGCATGTSDVARGLAAGFPERARGQDARMREVERSQMGAWAECGQPATSDVAWVASRRG